MSKNLLIIGKYYSRKLILKEGSTDFFQNTVQTDICENNDHFLVLTGLVGSIKKRKETLLFYGNQTI